MDYKKAAFYIVVILIAIFWYRYNQSEQSARLIEFDRFATVYAGVTVMAELYRNEPELFFMARDSIYESYQYNADSVDAFRLSLEGEEEDWKYVWESIRVKIDSLVEFYKLNPVDHNLTDSTAILNYPDSTEN